MVKITRINIQGLDIELTRKPRLKNIYLRVRAPDGIICATAPSGVEQELINEFILSNFRNIAAAREKILACSLRTRHEYTAGEKVYLWGRQYVLDVRLWLRKSYSVRTLGENMILTVPEASSHEGCREALNEFYRMELKRALPEVIEICSRRVGVQIKSFSVRNMKTCWGTCHIRKKRIILNLQLAAKPPECLEYVVIHELVHLIEKNHTKRFHALVSQNFPYEHEQRVKALLAESPLYV